MTSSNRKIIRGGTHRMFSSIRKRGTYANIAMTLALVFAMSGGAYAAGKYLITSTKQISPKVLKQLKGAKGPAGTQGLAGPAGPQGPEGKAGANGKDGTNGTDGVSVTGAAAANTECPNGGEKYTSASGSTAVCNGTNGQTGFTATLPKGQTEKGTWAAYFVTEGKVSELLPISFPIPLAAELEASQVHYILANGKEWDIATQAEATSPSTTCLGTSVEPKATAGSLCIYATSPGVNYKPYEFAGPEHIFNPSGPAEASTMVEGAGKAGAILQLPPENLKIVYGTWAVTAE
jgi:hypothetical protein